MRCVSDSPFRSLKGVKMEVLRPVWSPRAVVEPVGRELGDSAGVE